MSNERRRVQKRNLLLEFDLALLSIVKLSA
jgi:hypothetical protein